MLQWLLKTRLTQLRSHLTQWKTAFSTSRKNPQDALTDWDGSVLNQHSDEQVEEEVLPQWHQARHPVQYWRKNDCGQSEVGQLQLWPTLPKKEAYTWYSSSKFFTSARFLAMKYELTLYRPDPCSRKNVWISEQKCWKSHSLAAIWKTEPCSRWRRRIGTWKPCWWPSDTVNHWCSPPSPECTSRSSRSLQWVRRSPDMQW